MLQKYKLFLKLPNFSLPTYSATGRQDYTPILKDCKYQMECWGARGGDGLGSNAYHSTYGKGGYTTGIINLTSANLTSYPKLYVYVGNKGTNGVNSGTAAGGWNGGGSGGWDGQDDEACGGGGGATDIRTTQASNTASTWYSFDSMKSRIMVAGGGGGGAFGYDADHKSFGGCGGNTTAGKCYVLVSSTKNYCSGTPGSQDAGNKFGQGGNGKTAPFSNGCTGGGGSGYWGGTAATNTAAYNGRVELGGHGGSSYISGYSGCVAVLSGTSDSNLTFRSETNAVTKATHISGLCFTGGSMSNGDSSMPKPSAATGTMTGNSDSGYARITIKPYD